MTDLDPGTWTVASTAPLACGAGQRAGAVFGAMGPLYKEGKEGAVVVRGPWGPVALTRGGTAIRSRP
ncbi:hypothetical protein Scel_34230 [Streptomyces cellostaticus]|nr:hypothetical protein Scel_34230 [Streptomyces cellostaticus]